MLIHFINSGTAYLPELAAYEAFLRAKGHQMHRHASAATVPADAQVLWWICGRVRAEEARRHIRAFHIHEYASASVPPMAWLKDRIKLLQHPRPQYRLFQNGWVRDRMNFSDDVPYEYRDMGVGQAFLECSSDPVTPDFDFVYLGEMSRLRKFLPLLKAICGRGHRVLLIGQIPDELWQQLRHLPRIEASGRVPHEVVPALLRKARAGLNLVPNVIPYAHQTSTKLLEYCAVGLNVLTTDYPWVREFALRQSAPFVYLPKHAANALPWSTCFDAALDTPPSRLDMHAFAWPTLLAGMRLWREIGVSS